MGWGAKMSTNWDIKIYRNLDFRNSKGAEPPCLPAGKPYLLCLCVLSFHWQVEKKFVSGEREAALRRASNLLKVFVDLGKSRRNHVVLSGASCRPC